MFDEEQNLHIVMWFGGGGDLFGRIDSKGGKGVPEIECQFIFRQLFLAIEYMHSKNVAHRDIKAENILLANHSPRCLVRIGDFGSVVFTPSPSTERASVLCLLMPFSATSSSSPHLI